MSIRKISDLNSYLSSGIHTGGGSPSGSSTEKFSLENFQKSLFEISKLSSDTSAPLYSSRSINGENLISAMYIALSPYFANISALGPMSKKLIAVLDLFDFVDNSTTGYISAVNFGDTITFTVNKVIEGTSRRALWS